MRKTILFCDHCNQPIKGDGYYIEGIHKFYVPDNSDEVEIDIKFKEGDYCKDCFHETLKVCSKIK